MELKKTLSTLSYQETKRAFQILDAAPAQPKMPMKDSKGTAMKSRDTNGGGTTSGMGANSESKKDASPAAPNAGIRTDK